jgi:benzaldehyde dehydrogenase (NAD)
MPAPSPPFVPLYFGGQHRPSSTGATFRVHNSYSGDIVSIAAASSSADCVAAIEAAQHAQPGWEALGPQARHALLVKVATILESENWQSKARKAAEEEMSCPPTMQAITVMFGAGIVREAAAMASEFSGDTFQSGIPGGYAVVQRRARGVV